MSKFAGIDPGLTGGVVVLDVKGSVVLAWKMPALTVNGKRVFDYKRWIFGVAELCADFESSSTEIVSLYIEVTFQQIRRERGTKNVLPMRGAHEFAKVSGAQLAGAYLLAADRVRIITADSWRKAVGLAWYGEEDSWKKAAREACTRLFPENPEIAKHPGLADAALMALAALKDWKRR